METVKWTCNARKLPVAVVCALVFVLAAGTGKAGEEKTEWKRKTAVLLKMDERPVKVWEVYRAEKSEELVLVQLGKRFLRLDAKKREVWELEPEALEHHGQDLVERDDPAKRKLLKSSDWVSRSMGSGRLMRVRLNEEGRVLEVQIRERPDLRSLY